MNWDVHPPDIRILPKSWDLNRISVQPSKNGDLARCHNMCFSLLLFCQPHVGITKQQRSVGMHTYTTHLPQFGRVKADFIVVDAYRPSSVASKRYQQNDSRHLEKESGRDHLLKLNLQVGGLEHDFFFPYNYLE